MADETARTPDPAAAEPATTPERARYLVTVAPGAQIANVGFVSAGEVFTAPSDDYVPSRTFVPVNQAAVAGLAKLKGDLHERWAGSRAAALAERAAEARRKAEAASAASNAAGTELAEVERRAAEMALQAGALEERLAATDQGDAKAMGRLVGELTAARTVLAVFVEGRVPRLKAAAERAFSESVAAAQQADRLDAAVAANEARADAAEVTRRLELFSAEVAALLGAHEACCQRARALAQHAGQEAPNDTNWEAAAALARPGASVARMFEVIGKALENIASSRGAAALFAAQVAESQALWRSHPERVTEFVPPGQGGFRDEQPEPRYVTGAVSAEEVARTASEWREKAQGGG